MSDSLFILTSLSFASPWVFIFPLLIAFCWLLRRDGPVRSVPYAIMEHLEDCTRSWRVFLRAPLLGILYCLFIASLTLAAARPQRISGLPSAEESRNIMIVIDTSRSMSGQDFGGDYGRVSRLAAVRAVVSQFIEKRRGDRIGLVVFGNSAFLQAPLTRDHKLLQSLISKMQTGMAGNGTAIGDGLGLALKRVKDIKKEARAIILMTDGVSNAGQVNPLQAASVAVKLGIKVHTVGIGSKDQALHLPGQFFSGGGVEFDEKLLQDIAQDTGGVYFHAADLGGLEKVYREIDKLETSERDEEQLQKVEELFSQYAFAALLFYLLHQLLSLSVFMKVP